MVEDGSLPRDVAMTLRALLRAVAEDRDRQAFASLYRYLAPQLVAWIERRGEPRHVAEEVTQDVMVQVWRDAPIYSPRQDPTAWVFAMTRDLLTRDAVGLTIVEPAVVHDAVTWPETEPASGVREFLDLLTDDERSALSVVLVEGKSHITAANELGVPVGTLKSRIKRGMARLRDAMRCSQGSS